MGRKNKVRSRTVRMRTPAKVTVGLAQFSEVLCPLADLSGLCDRKGRALDSLLFLEATDLNRTSIQCQ